MIKTRELKIGKYALSATYSDTLRNLTYGAALALSFRVSWIYRVVEANVICLNRRFTLIISKE